MESYRGPERRESSNVSPERVGRVSAEILESRESLDFLVAKIQQKINFKRQASVDDGSNDFAPWKRLGMFIVHEQRLPRELVSILQRHGVDIESDEVLELHIPPQAASLAAVKQSFDRLRDYLAANRGERHIPKFIYGVSYLAHLAKRWGFTVVDLPEGIQDKSGAANVLRSYASGEMDSRKKSMAEKFTTRDIKLCFIAVEDLLNGVPEISR